MAGEIDIAIKAVGLGALVFAYRQLLTNTRAHLFTVYKDTFAMLEEPALRVARQWVYEMKDRACFETEKWIDMAESPPDAKGDQLKHWEHKQHAERTLRLFDKLALLVREGRVPLNFIARFYARPVLLCWYQLSPYVEALRKRRQQPGHHWEYENLVFNIVIPALKGDEVRGGLAIWKGVALHDGLCTAHVAGTTVNLVGQERLGFRDKDYGPPLNTWVLSEDPDSPFGP